MMERQIRQMVRLIDDLLDVSRIASGKIVLQRVPSSLTDLVQNAIEAHRTAIEAARIDADRRPADAAMRDRCGSDALRAGAVERAAQCLEVHACTRSDPRRRRHSRGDDAPQAAITVSDTGTGISNELLPRVFELFVQAEAVTERAHGGLGIGLALARRLIEMHGGEIAAHSDGPGHGAVFVITIPLCETAAARQSPAADRPAPRGEPCRDHRRQPGRRHHDVDAGRTARGLGANGTRCRERPRSGPGVSARHRVSRYRDAWHGRIRNVSANSTAAIAATHRHGCRHRVGAVAGQATRARRRVRCAPDEAGRSDGPGQHACPAALGGHPGPATVAHLKRPSPAAAGTSRGCPAVHMSLEFHSLLSRGAGYSAPTAGKTCTDAVSS